VQNALIKALPSSFLGLAILKKIEAVVSAARLESAFTALRELDLGGFTYYDSKGRGQIPRPEIHSGRGTGTYRPEFNMNATIVVVAPDSMADKVIEKILESTSTGLTGEGKIFVSDVDEVIDIGSKQRGEGAL
jgi:nitrogen regulatory protein P-II 1